MNTQRACSLIWNAGLLLASLQACGLFRRWSSSETLLHLPLAVQEAAERYYEFQAGVYADPMFKGDYPASVKRRVPSYILPRISPELKKDLLASVDFYGMNHYTAMHAPYPSQSCVFLAPHAVCLVHVALATWRICSTLFSMTRHLCSGLCGPPPLPVSNLPAPSQPWHHTSHSPCIPILQLKPT